MGDEVAGGGLGVVLFVGEGWNLGWYCWLGVLLSVRRRSFLLGRDTIYCTGLSALVLGRLVCIAATLGCSWYLLEAWSRFTWSLTVGFLELGEEYTELVFYVNVANPEYVRF